MPCKYNLTAILYLSFYDSAENGIIINIFIVIIDNIITLFLLYLFFTVGAQIMVWLFMSYKIGYYKIKIEIVLIY